MTTVIKIQSILSLFAITSVILYFILISKGNNSVKIPFISIEFCAISTNSRYEALALHAQRLLLCQMYLLNRSHIVKVYVH